MKRKKQKRMTIFGQSTPPTEISKFRALYLKKGFDLVNITGLCIFKLGKSGWCNDFNEPDEEIYHIQVNYRDQWIGNLNVDNSQPNWKDGYVIFVTNKNDCVGADFIIFRKVKL